MSYQLPKSVSFGASRAGLTTVAYSLDGTNWTTSGVSEISPGVYEASIVFADDFAGTLSWRTGEASRERFAYEAIDPSQQPTPSTETGIAPPLNGLDAVYCTDENIALRAWGDYTAICPPSQKLAAGTDGVIQATDQWTLLSATANFLGNSVVPGNVVWLKSGNTFGSNGELFAIQATGSGSVTLRRLGQAAGVGQPPAPASGLAGITFAILTFGPQIDVASYDANHFFGIDPASATKSPGRMYDQRELQSFTVLTVLRRAYGIEVKQKGGDYVLKLEQITNELADLKSRLVVRWGADGKSEPPTSVFSARVRR